MQQTYAPENRPGKKRTLLIAAIAVLLCALAWYFLYFTKTPAYSLELIRTALQKHDTAAFQKHVDLDAILPRAYDDLIAATLKDDPRIKDNPFAAGIAAMFKQPLVAALKEGILLYIETGSPDKPEGQAPSGGNSPKIKIESKTLAEKTGLKNATLKGIAYTKKDGKTATLGLTIYHPDLKETTVLDLKMRELDDGTWQAIEISNLQTYLAEIKKAQKAAGGK